MQGGINKELFFYTEKLKDKEVMLSKIKNVKNWS